MAMSDLVPNINIIAEYLAHPEIHELSSTNSVDCIVLCFSSVLYQAETFFTILQERPSLTKTLVLCGGKGHSTQHIYDALATHPKYQNMAGSIQDLSEARVLGKILNEYFNVSAIKNAGCNILIEDQSTNCGNKASLTREVLETSGISIGNTCIIIQDPTMSLRTKASFIKAFENSQNPPNFLTCPIFTPKVKISDTGLQYDMSSIPSPQLWPLERFMDLIMGEIPRLRDDENGYGPNGRGFIAHVEMPANIVKSWENLGNVFKASR